MSLLLGVNEALDVNLDERYGAVRPGVAESMVAASKLHYWALVLSNGSSRENEELAASIIKDIEPKTLEQMMLLEIAYSSTDDQLIMKGALRKNFDVNKKCEKLGCFPATWAAFNGAVECVDLLLSRSPSAYEDLPFIRSYTGFIDDPGVLEQYVKTLEAMKEAKG